MSLPSTTRGATSVQSTTLPSSTPDAQSPLGELRAPLSVGVVNPARVEHDRNAPVPAPSSVSSSLRTEPASPVPALRVVPRSAQKIPDNTSVTPPPTSANLTSQGRNLRSTSGQVAVAQVSQSQSVSTPQVKSPVQISASVPHMSTSSGQNEPRPPRRRQSSGLDFLQLDLQVARQKKLIAAKLASGAQKSDTTPASPGAVPSPTTKDGHTTPAALTSAPAITAAAQASAQTPGTTQASISAIEAGVSDTASQPQIVQTPSPTLVHRDLRQGSSRVRPSGASPRKLRITDRAPAPPPEPGSSSAPIVIDEEEAFISTTADGSIDVDVGMQPQTQTEETPMSLDSDPQNVQGSDADAKDDHAPQHDEQQVSLHDKPSVAQPEQTKHQGKAGEDSVEGLDSSNNDIVSSATMVPSLGNESPVLSKDSTHTAVGVISAPTCKDSEMTSPAPTRTPSIAVATEPSASPDHPTISVPSVVVEPSGSDTVTLGVRPQEEKGGSEMSVDPSLPMGQAASQTPSISSGKASLSTPLGLHAAPQSSIGSLSDMDISFTSDTPPIVVLGTRASHSRSTSLQSGKISSEGGTELVRAEEIEEDASEMVDELAPLFGKEMKVICMDRAYDVPGEFTWGFTLSHTDWDRVSQWAKAPENLECVSRPLFPHQNRLIFKFRALT